MRKTTSAVAKMQKRCKLCIRQLIDLQIVWGINAKMQPLYKNIKSYYYYIELRKYAHLFFASFGIKSQQTLYSTMLHRMQHPASLDANSASFDLLNPETLTGRVLQRMQSFKTSSL